jgi:hypothetical protein
MERKMNKTTTTHNMEVRELTVAELDEVSGAGFWGEVAGALGLSAYFTVAVGPATSIAEGERL